MSYFSVICELKESLDDEDFMAYSERIFKAEEKVDMILINHEKIKDIYSDSYKNQRLWFHLIDSLKHTEESLGNVNLNKAEIEYHLNGNRVEIWDFNKLSNKWLRLIFQKFKN